MTAHQEMKRRAREEQKKRESLGGVVLPTKAKEIIDKIVEFRRLNGALYSKSADLRLAVMELEGKLAVQAAKLILRANGVRVPRKTRKVLCD